MQLFPKIIAVGSVDKTRLSASPISSTHTKEVEFITKFSLNRIFILIQSRFTILLSSAEMYAQVANVTLIINVSNNPEELSNCWGTFSKLAIHSEVR